MENFARLAFSIAAVAATLSACGGVTPNYQYSGRMLFVNGRPITAARLSPVPHYARIAPHRHSKQGHFEYIINNYNSYASIFDYPKSDQQIGEITNVGGQGCTNALYGYGKRIIWIVAADNNITEYRIPKKAIKTLSDSVGSPSSCAMDTSGDLAVGILHNYIGPGGGDVVIFKNASGSGTVYTTPLAHEYFDGYDNQGNLFADGLTAGSSFALVELPKGGSQFETITTSNAVQFPGSVQWDGTYLTIFDQLTSEMYQYTISGTKATLQHTISFSGVGDCGQTWIVKGIVYCADAFNDDGEVFKYPAGGSIIATFTGKFDLPLGVTVAEP